MSGTGFHRERLQLLFDLRVGLNGQRLFPGLTRLYGLLEFRVDVAQVIEQRGVRFLGQFDRAEDLRQRFLGPVQLEKHPAEAVEKRAVVRLDLQRALNEFLRFNQIGANNKLSRLCK